MKRHWVIKKIHYNFKKEFRQKNTQPLLQDLYKWWFQNQCSGGRMVPVGRSWLQVIFILIVDITWYCLLLNGLECSSGREKKRKDKISPDLFSPRWCQIQDGKPTEGTGGSPSHLQPTCLSVINYYPSLCLIYLDLCNYILANAS